MSDFVTKDSGERAQFDSGMQRDTEAGKPRFDLMMPLDIPYEEQFLTRVAALLGRGAEKYEDRNWEKANSEAELARMRSSAYRHFIQWITGETDEDHAAAVVFNLLAHETIRYKIEQAISNALESQGEVIGTWGGHEVRVIEENCLTEEDIDLAAELLDGWETVGYLVEDEEEHTVAEAAGFKAHQDAINEALQKLVAASHGYAAPRVFIPTVEDVEIPRVSHRLFQVPDIEIEWRDPMPVTLARLIYDGPRFVASETEVTDLDHPVANGVQRSFDRH